ncbi:hypothetical protein DFH06DRAFT_1234982 [Mycena polygramma]|nr:hypothetical protein DFH06DRAFT_1234982 [Mycena polygramma]
MAKFTLTEAHVKTLLDPARDGTWRAFVGAIDPSVRWVIASGTKNPCCCMAGVYNLASWIEEIGALSSLLVDGLLKMTVSSIDVIGHKAIVEVYGEATTTKGRPYNNRYAWFLVFSEETGKIVEIREYMNTAMVQEMIQAK